MTVDAGVYGDVMIPFWIFGSWGLGILIGFITFYIYDWLGDDVLLGVSWVVILLWPLSAPIWVCYRIIKQIGKGWVIIGGPKIKRLPPDKYEKEREKVWDKLHVTMCEARNLGISGSNIMRMAVRHALKDTKSEEIAQIISDATAKEVHDS